MTCIIAFHSHFLVSQLLSHLASQLPPGSTVVDIGPFITLHQPLCKQHNFPFGSGTLFGLSAIALAVTATTSLSSRTSSPNISAAAPEVPTDTTLLITSNQKTLKSSSFIHFHPL
jgi:hypothetical protein